ncbi:MAG TPA: tRNA (cytidine(34)-2'-O)-methyltransferase [Pseudobdellovibrionaceae bacterium]|nr:tRNA (cytidine(34)-2'-O)-methyltransferase [Pseudobdellovibrionaceae bacterium]
MNETYFRIVLIEPEIPQNTGNIGRTCVATCSELHLVGELGFTIDDKQVKRAGLDYWPHLKLFRHASYADWMQKVEDPSRVFFFTTKTTQVYTKVQFKKGDWLVFGKETKGLAPEILQKFPQQNLTIPIIGPARSLNLATAVAIAAYEGVRQVHESAKPV